MNMDTHGENLERVGMNLRTAIYQFLEAKIEHGQPTFYADEITKYVQRAKFSAPGSALRILRDEKRKGNLEYTLLSRSQSHYRIDSLHPPVLQ